MASVTWNVINPDMWGHVPADCSGAYGCKCVKTVDDKDVHDDDHCECHEEENDRRKCGSFELDEDADDAAIIRALVEEGFFNEKALTRTKVEDFSDGYEIDIVDNDGRKLYVLQREDRA